MTQRVKAPVAKPANLNSIPRTDMTEREKKKPTPENWLLASTYACVYSQRVLTNNNDKSMYHLKTKRRLMIKDSFSHQHPPPQV